ncbi:Protein kinase domain containing protein [Reticulomyxa filosa]|uniref:Protein kinase domain containing protein n=1 Tax=Reticulomyxa filosa TaxID=46433 RepID=X6MUX6_RETFI|nr:Protein kinase domain containing protein [Reticulomyxa filosa]|eukprot:ETO17436.1 Protein kinase domain containing protein [Reticulomyxa filosa]
MDVAEVKNLHERSQRQLGGAVDADAASANANVQKTGLTLKDAIAAAQKQATTFVNRLAEDEKHRESTTQQQSFRRPVSTPVADYANPSAKGEDTVINVLKSKGERPIASKPLKSSFYDVYMYLYIYVYVIERANIESPIKKKKKKRVGGGGEKNKYVYVYVMYVACMLIIYMYVCMYLKKKYVYTICRGLPPPPTQAPQEYVDGYDSDESMYAPQFANGLNNRSNRIFSLDDSLIRESQRDMSNAFEQLKAERGLGHSKQRLHQQVQIGLPDKEGQLTEPEFYQKYWIEAGKLGEGSFARVRKITRKHDRKPFALKVIKKAGKSKEDLDALQKEIEILRKLNHKNVVRLTDWVETKKRIHMVVEFCNGGDVFERILKKKTFSEWEASHVVQQVAEGLDHIHSKGIVHRDLKPDNLMYLDSSPDAEIKIIDFGLAGDCSKSPLKTPCGTAHYVAPEVLSQIPYDTQADMWSLGVIIYMLLCGFPPFFDATGNQKRLYQLIKSGKFRFPSPYWDYISEQAKDVIKGLLTKDPKQRMTAAEVLAHPWIAGKAVKKEMSDLYMEQMKFFQSSKHFTNIKIGQEEPQETEQKPVKIFAKQQYAFDYE